MRGLVALFAIAAAVAGAAFFADHPGHVAIVWRDWQIDTSVGVLLASGIAAAVAMWAALSFLGWLVRLPRALRRRSTRRRRQRGRREVASGLIALAAGESDAATRHARQASRLLPEAPLSLLLSAQAAQADGDRPLAQQLYTAMLERPALALAGMRGLLSQAVESGDHRTALRLAEQARQMRPDSVWLNRSLLALETRTGDWPAAAETLAAAAKRKLFPADRARHQRGVILYELSLAAERDGDSRRAASLAAKAQALAPDLPEPAIHYARLLLAAGRRRAARRSVERAWRASPNPELAQLWGEMHSDQPPLDRVRAFERLAGDNPNAAESHMAAAEAALDAALWGEARRHLGIAAAAMPDGPSRRQCLLMARLEEGEYGPGTGARDWLDRAAAAPPDPGWHCPECGAHPPAWYSTCQTCGAFDSLRWETSLDGQRARAPISGASPGAPATNLIVPAQAGTHASAAPASE